MNSLTINARGGVSPAWLSLSCDSKPGMLTISFHGSTDHALIFIPFQVADTEVASVLNRSTAPNGVKNSFDAMLREFHPEHRAAVLKMVRTFLAAVCEDAVSTRTYPSVPENSGL